LQNPLRALLDLPEEEKAQRGLEHTPREIYQQPATWINTYQYCLNRRTDLMNALRRGGIGRGSASSPTVYLIGAGTSDYTGRTIAPLLRQRWGCDVWPVASTTLLTDFDDRLVVFGSGEEVSLEFNPSVLPILPKNWTRDYFFLANGYEKDMDFYAAEGSTVEPLPFRGMGTYPYPGKSFPLDEKHLDYLLNFNTRQMSGNEPRGYWYDYSHPK